MVQMINKVDSTEPFSEQELKLVEMICAHVAIFIKSIDKSARVTVDPGLLAED